MQLRLEIAVPFHEKLCYSFGIHLPLFHVGHLWEPMYTTEIVNCGHNVSMPLIVPDCASVDSFILRAALLGASWTLRMVQQFLHTIQLGLQITFLPNPSLQQFDTPRKVFEDPILKNDTTALECIRMTRVIVVRPSRLHHKHKHNVNSGRKVDDDRRKTHLDNTLGAYPKDQIFSRSTIISESAILSMH